MHFLIVLNYFLLFFLQSIIPISISRVNQVDAQRLDVEMSAMLKEQLVNVFNLVKVCIIYLIWLFVEITGIASLGFNLFLLLSLGLARIAISM